MVEVSEIGLKGEEVELDLGLSIGGCFRKSEKLKPVERELVIPFISRNNSIEVDLRLIENQRTLFRSSASPSEIDSGNEIVDLQTKRDIQALRRQVAKKKQQKKRWRGRNSMIENAIEDQRASKRDKTYSSGFENNGVKNGNLNMCNTQTEKHPVQFVPYTHGFAYPFLMPCWNPTGKEKNGVEPANCQGFRPFLPYQSLGLNDKREGETKITTSNGSPKCSSSSVFDHPSSSHEGTFPFLFYILFKILYFFYYRRNIILLCSYTVVVFLKENSNIFSLFILTSFKNKRKINKKITPKKIYNK